MPHYRTLKNLYFQFIQGTEFENVLQWHHAADALNRRGYIVLVPDRSGEAMYKGYFETKQLHEIPEDRFEQTIYEVLRQYAIDQGLI